LNYFLAVLGQMPCYRLFLIGWTCHADPDRLSENIFEICWTYVTCWTVGPRGGIAA